MFRVFSSVFQPFRSPTPRVGLENTATGLYGARSTMFKGVIDRVLRVLGCAIQSPVVVYTSVTRINSAFPAIGSVSNITSAIIAQYACDVEAEINGAISNRYTLPLAVECPILTAIATRETIYRIAVQRALVQFPPAQQGKAPLLVQHEDDQKLLGNIAAGKMGLVSVTGATVVVGGILIYSTTKTYVPTMHEGAWGDMVVDTNKLDDIASDREF